MPFDISPRCAERVLREECASSHCDAMAEKTDLYWNSAVELEEMIGLCVLRL